MPTMLIARPASRWRQVPVMVLLLAAQVAVGLLVLVLRTARAARPVPHRHRRDLRGVRHRVLRRVLRKGGLVMRLLYAAGIILPPPLIVIAYLLTH